MITKTGEERLIHEVERFLYDLGGNPSPEQQNARRNRLRKMLRLVQEIYHKELIEQVRAEINGERRVSALTGLAIEDHLRIVGMERVLAIIERG